MTSTTLESLLEGAVHNLRAEQASSPAAAQPTPEPVEGNGQAEAQASETGAQKDGPPPSHEDEPADAEGRLKALIGERKKRQETEQKLNERDKAFDELQKRLERLESGGQPQAQQPKPAAKPAEVPDPWLDPEGYARHIAEEADKRSFRTLVSVSQGVMRTQHDDYDDVEKVFREECKSNPFLAQQLRTSSFPARFAYEQGKRLMALREIGDDPTAFKAKIEAELKAKLEAEKSTEPQTPAPTPALAPQAASPTPKPPPPPPSLAGVTSAAPRKAAAKFEGPTPLDAILR
jgi:hypothetical protein